MLAMVRIPVYRVCLTTIYACGLRLLEGAHLQVADVDSARMVLHIHGKGKQDRYVPLPAPILPGLRAYWRTHRSREWMFPAPPRRGLAHSLVNNGGPVRRSSLQSAFGRAVLAGTVIWVRQPDQPSEAALDIVAAKNSQSTMPDTANAG